MRVDSYEIKPDGDGYALDIFVELSSGEQLTLVPYDGFETQEEAEELAKKVEAELDSEGKLDKVLHTVTILDPLATLKALDTDEGRALIERIIKGHE